jgi:hypothetical protein
MVRQAFIFSLTLLVVSTSPSAAHGGGFGGGGGGHSMSSFHSSSMSSPHMGFSRSFSGGSGFSSTGMTHHFETGGWNPFSSPYVHSEMGAQAGQGLTHGWGRFFGFGSHAPVNTAVTPATQPAIPSQSLASFTNPGLGNVRIQPTNPPLPSYGNPFFGNVSHYPGNYFASPYYGYRHFNPYYYNNWSNPYFYPPGLYSGMYNPYFNPFYNSYFGAYPYLGGYPYMSSYPYFSDYSYQTSLDPSFISSGTIDPNAVTGYGQYGSPDGNWIPPAYSPSSGITDPDLVPFDMSAPPVVSGAVPPDAGSGGDSGYNVPQDPSGWTP